MSQWVCSSIKLDGDKMFNNYWRIWLVIFILSPFYLFGQGEFNQWRFGIHAGMDFNYSPPISVSGSLNDYSDAVSVSDSLGNLLFYSDGGSYLPRKILYHIQRQSGSVRKQKSGWYEL